MRRLVIVIVGVTGGGGGGGGGGTGASTKFSELVPFTNVPARASR